jgi:hypothetical protein
VWTGLGWAPVADQRTAGIPALAIVNASTLLAQIDFGTANYKRIVHAHATALGSASGATAAMRMMLGANGTTYKATQMDVPVGGTQTATVSGVMLIPAGPGLVTIYGQNVSAGTFSTVGDGTFSQLNVMVTPA